MSAICSPSITSGRQWGRNMQGHELWVTVSTATALVLLRPEVEVIMHIGVQVFKFCCQCATCSKINFWIKIRVIFGINCRKQLIFINSLELPTLLRVSLLLPGCLELEEIITPWGYPSKIFVNVTQKFSIIVILRCHSRCVLTKSELMRVVVTDVTYPKFPFKFERTLWYLSYGSVFQST